MVSYAVCVPKAAQQHMCLCDENSLLHSRIKHHYHKFLVRLPKPRDIACRSTTSYFLSQSKKKNNNNKFCWIQRHLEMRKSMANSIIEPKSIQSPRFHVLAPVTTRPRHHTSAHDENQ